MAEHLTSSQVIFDAVRELDNAEQIATRETIAEVTGLKLSIVDEHIKNLCNDGRLRRIQRGIYQSITYPPLSRAISVTMLPDGLSKLEIGDVCLDLWPRERRYLGSLLQGSAYECSTIQGGHEAGLIASKLTEMMEKLERRVTSFIDKPKAPRQVAKTPPTRPPIQKPASQIAARI